MRAHIGSKFPSGKSMWTGLSKKFITRTNLFLALLQALARVRILILAISAVEMPVIPREAGGFHANSCAGRFSWNQ